MCKTLSISRSQYYYQNRVNQIDSNLENLVISLFKRSRQSYGSRKLNIELRKHSYKISRKRIRQIMNKYDLVSKYCKTKYKSHSTKCNSAKIANVIDRNFKPGLTKNVIVSDLTYVKVADKWNYICIIIDLYNREIVGFSVGKQKNADLVKRAFASIKSSLFNMKIFHTDRGMEFRNNQIDQLLETFNIERSLSKKGNPYDNSVAEATFKVIKTEFVHGKKFMKLQELEIAFNDYVNWFNNQRIHSSLGYKTPVEFKYVSE